MRSSHNPVPDDLVYGHYVACGRYHHFLQTYFADVFSRSNIKVFLFDELSQQRPNRFSPRICLSSSVSIPIDPIDATHGTG